MNLRTTRSVWYFTEWNVWTLSLHTPSMVCRIETPKQTLGNVELCGRYHADNAHD